MSRGFRNEARKIPLHEAIDELIQMYGLPQFLRCLERDSDADTGEPRPLGKILQNLHPLAATVDEDHYRFEFTVDRDGDRIRSAVPHSYERGETPVLQRLDERGNVVAEVRL